MNTNDFLTKVEELELPKLDFIPYTILSNMEVEKFGLNKEGYSVVYLFNNSEILQPATYSELSKITDNKKYIRIKMFDATSYNNPLGTNYFTYFNYIEDMNVVGIYLVAFNSKSFNIGEIRNFEIIDHYYITKDRAFVYKNNNKWISEYDIEEAKRKLPFSYRNDEIVNGNYSMAITNLFGLYERNGEYLFSNDASELYRFFGTQENINEEKITKKLTAITQKYMSKELPNLSYTATSGAYKHTIVKLEYIDETASAIRWFKRGSNNVNYEYMRFYVTDDANFLCVLKNDGNFHVITKNINKDAMFTGDFLMDREELKNSKFKYFFDMIDNFPQRKKAIFLYETFRFDLIEKFSKTGMQNFVNDSLSAYFNSRILPYTTIGKLFGVKINPKETDIYKALKINKYQYKKIVPYTNKTVYYNVESNPYAMTMRILRLILGGEKQASLNNVDNATFDKYFDLIYSCTSQRNYYINSMEKFAENVNGFYSLDSIYNGFLAMKMLLSSNNGNMIRTLTDYVNMVRKIDDKKSFPMKFPLDNIDNLKTEITNAHDGAVEVYNLIREKVRTDEFVEKIKKCDKWTYEEEEMSVIAPTKPADLAKEGLELRHCVRSYIDRVAEGRTNIMFIRKSNEVDKPFFTVEISNNGTIEQIHGFANRNINTEPNLEEFVKRWSKNKKLNISNINKVR